MSVREVSSDKLFLSETIRLEGYLTKENFQGAAVSNKDIYILKKLDLNYKNLYQNKRTLKHLVIVIYLNNINIHNIINKSLKDMHFHIGKDKRLIFIQPLEDFNISLEYILKTSEGDKTLKIYLDKEKTIRTSCEIHSTAYATLQIYNVKLTREMHYNFEIPIGIGSRKSYILDFPFDIEDLTEKQIITVLDVAISCEGCVFYNKDKGDRVIKIKIASKKYLEKLNLLFLRIGVKGQKIKPTTDCLFILEIRKRRNLEIINHKVSLTSQRKSRILQEMINSYSDKRFSHYEAINSYLGTLKTLNQVSAKKLSKILNRNENTVYTALKNLSKKGYAIKTERIFTGNGSLPSLFKISEKGKEYLAHR